MKDLYRTVLKVIIVVVIIGVIVNDSAAYLFTYYSGQDEAKEIAKSFALEYRQSESEGSALEAAKNTAAARGTEIISYKFDESTVHVTIKTGIEKTVIISRVEALKKYRRVKVSASAEIKI